MLWLVTCDAGQTRFGRGEPYQGISCLGCGVEVLPVHIRKNGTYTSLLLYSGNTSSRVSHMVFKFAVS